MDETALNQALGSINLSLTVLVSQINQGLRTIKAQSNEIAQLKQALASKESAVEQATRQAGLGKIEEPIYTETKP